jgi:hypothetical protein
MELDGDSMTGHHFLVPAWTIFSNPKLMALGRALSTMKETVTDGGLDSC